MILHLEGNANRYYVQTLCLVFFPGSTFGENEMPGFGIPEVSVAVYNEDDGATTAFVRMKLNDKICEASETLPQDAVVHIADASSVAVGKAMFAAGKSLLGHIPPWGILTGVRPAKVAGALLEEDGKGVLKARRILRDEYFLTPQKAALAVSVSATEQKILRKLPEETCSLYVSIPFCPSRCAYCSFVSFTSSKLLGLLDEYFERLLDEIEETFHTVRSLGRRVLTVYIGGGTPTILSAKNLGILLSAIEKHLIPGECVEFTLEAGRPDTITAEKLAIAKAHGVTRVSVNPQTLSDDILREIGRKHTADDFFRAYALAKESGIRDVNVDLIAGLPGDDFKTFSDSIDRVIALDPENITVHTFSVKRAADATRSGGVYLFGGAADVGKCVSYSQFQTKFAGYRPYYLYRQKNTVGNLENVGFAKEGHEGLYNILMMEEKQTIFAVGAGGVTKLVSDDGKRILRLFHPKYPYEYLRACDKNDETSLKTKQEREEQIAAFFRA